MKTLASVLAGLTIVAWTAFLGGCATISSGSTQEMSFQSNPSLRDSRDRSLSQKHWLSALLR